MCKAFYYKKYDFNPISGVLTLTYQVNKHLFTETITFPNAPFHLSETQQEVLNEIFFLTHIAFGISYYKAFCPPEIIIESGELSKEQAAFFNTFFWQGLGEFAVRNALNLHGKINFPFTKKNVTSLDILLKNRFLLPVGGGKDSCVSIELLKRSQNDCCAISVGNPRPIHECVHISLLPHLVIQRTIAPNLIELNKSGAVYNGHVPITGMLAFVLWASAILYDYQFVALSCEASANTGNLMQGELSVNHQYSKSFQFETDFYHLTKQITPSFLYFSLLRPFLEIKIAHLFSLLCGSYFPVFTSCNKAFKLDESLRLNRWCGSCDKCRFVFLILAPFMDKETLIKAVGTNPLDDITQLTGFKELLGLSGHKPFECVGETNECRLAFLRLASSKEWQNDLIIQHLKNQVPSVSQDLFNASSHHLIPQELYNAIQEVIK